MTGSSNHSQSQHSQRHNSSSSSSNSSRSNASHSFKLDAKVSHTSEIYDGREGENHSRQPHQQEQIQPVPAVLKYTPLPLGDSVDHSLPPLHPDVLQQRFAGSDISLLPVPRIMYLGSNGNGGPYRVGGSTFVSQLGLGGGSDHTVDENTQMADMIALKYLGKKGGLTVANEVQGNLEMLVTCGNVQNLMYLPLSLLFSQDHCASI